MKSLFIIRHAKSDWEDASLRDFDRTLNKRGKRDAPEMAKRLLDKNVKIDAFISSPAVRALTTCKLFAKEFDYKEKDIILAPQLYEAPASAYYDVIHKTGDDFKSIAIFAHNPGATAFVNNLTNTRVDNMPTCSVFAVKCDIKHWKDFSDGNNEFWFFDYPENGH
jgi:phosphohistidine phosphatase